MPGSGRPTVPARDPVPAASGTLTATTGAISVQPYPSIRSTPNFSLNADAIGSRSRSAPTIASRSAANWPGWHLRAYAAQNVGVLTRSVAPYFDAISPIVFASIGFG